MFTSSIIIVIPFSKLTYRVNLSHSERTRVKCNVEWHSGRWVREGKNDPVTRGVGSVTNADGSRSSLVELVNYEFELVTATGDNVVAVLLAGTVTERAIDRTT